MRRLSPQQTRVARAAAQGLGGTAGTVADAVRQVVGVQAQDFRAARLAVRVRTTGLTTRDVDDAVRTRTVVRTWAMRGTLHLLAADDFLWLHSLIGPYFAARGAPRRRQLGLGEELLERAAVALETIAAEPVTRGHIVERLADHGVRLDARTQAPTHLLGYAANTGQLCRGPDTASGAPTYVLVREWLGRPPGDEVDEDAALCMLAERYLRGHGPATAEDLATWSGLPVTMARRAFGLLGDRVAHVEAAGHAAVVLGDESPPDVPSRLLGHFDAYLLGYRGRDLAVPKAYQSAVQAGGGFVMPVVLREGEAVGTWRMTSTQDAIRVAAAGFGGRKLPDTCNEVADLGRFLDKRAAPEASRA